MITTFRTGDRNGLPGFRPYVYRGDGQDTLTAWMDEPDKTGRERVHYGTDDTSRCSVGAKRRPALTADPAQVTCGRCKSYLGIGSQL